MQACTSENTCINRVPAVFKWKRFKEHRRWTRTNLDIGGGKYPTASKFLREEYGIDNTIYDPFHRSHYDNLFVMGLIKGGTPFDTITVCNTLNVIDCDKMMRTIIMQAARACVDDTTVFFQIYEGDRSGIGGETTRGYQRNQPAHWYLQSIRQWFCHVESKGKFILAHTPMPGLPLVPFFCDKLRTDAIALL